MSWIDNDDKTYDRFCEDNRKAKLMTYRDEGISRIFKGLFIAGGLLVLFGFALGVIVGLAL